MRRLIILLAAVLLVALSAVAALSLLLTPERANAEITSRVSTLTGLNVVIEGETRLRLFPSLRFVVNDVRVHTAQGDELASIRAITGSIALLPLVSGRVEIESVSLIGPSLVLQTEADGRANWALGEGALLGAALERPDIVPASGVRLGDLRIEDGRLRHIDKRDGTVHEAEAIRANLSWPTLADPFSASGSLEWRGDPVSLNVTTDRPLAMIKRGASAVRLSITSDLVNASYAGQARLLSDAISLDGRLSLATRSAPRLLERTGTNPGGGIGFEELELAGELQLHGGSAVISDLRMTVDGNRAEGSMKLDLDGDPIGIQGTLAFDRLDMDRYRAAEQQEEPARQDRNRLAAPLDLSDLHKTTADIRVSAGQIRWGDLRLGEAAGTITVQDGTLTLGIAEAALHGGVAAGTVTASQDASGVVVRIGARLEGVAAGDLLGQFVAFDRVSGTGTASATLSARGRTLNDILADLSGNARFVIEEGALAGLDIPALVTTIRAGRMEGWPVGDGARTPFGELAGSFQLAGGIATTTDFRLDSPMARVDLAGDVDLVAAGLSLRGVVERREDETGAGMPFIVEGPWARPWIYPDPRWLLEQAGGRHRDRLGNIVDRLEDYRADERIDGAIRESLDRLPGFFGRQ